KWPTRNSDGRGEVRRGKGRYPRHRPQGAKDGDVSSRRREDSFAEVRSQKAGASKKQKLAQLVRFGIASGSGLGAPGFDAWMPIAADGRESSPAELQRAEHR